MVIGIPKEIKKNENRVSILPSGVDMLIKSGHKVLVETDAGSGSGFSDNDYINAGGLIVRNAKNVYNKSELILKVKEPQNEEIELIKENQIIFTYFHFASSKDLTDRMIDTKSIALAYETVQNDKNELPLLTPMSEVAGRMAVQNGAKCLEQSFGGKGKLLSGVPGVSPCNVTILGAGTVGMNAAKLAAGMGAHSGGKIHQIREKSRINVTQIRENRGKLHQIREKSREKSTKSGK